jgi:hypothetical protein
MTTTREEPIANIRLTDPDAKALAYAILVRRIESSAVGGSSDEPR